MKLLIDANLSPDVMDAFTRAGGRAEIVHLRDWSGGKFVNQHGQRAVIRLVALRRGAVHAEEIPVRSLESAVSRLGVAVVPAEGKVRANLGWHHV